MRAKLVSVGFASTSFFLGILLPYCTVGDNRGILNLFWSFVYGCGLWITDETFGLHNKVATAAAVFLWPLMVFTVMVVCVYKHQLDSGGKLSRKLMLLFVMTIAVVVNRESALTHPLDELPTFYRFFFIAW